MACPDLAKLLAAFGAHGVRCLIGGAHAVALHARPRATKDLDIYLAATPANARRVVRAVAEFFGGAAPGMAAEKAQGHARRRLVVWSVKGNGTSTMSSFVGLAGERSAAGLERGESLVCRNVELGCLRQRWDLRRRG